MKATATSFVFECSGWTQLVIEVVTEAIESDVGVKLTLHNVFKNEVSFAIDKTPTILSSWNCMIPVRMIIFYTRKSGKNGKKMGNSLEFLMEKRCIVHKV